MLAATNASTTSVTYVKSLFWFPFPTIVKGLFFNFCAKKTPITDCLELANKVAGLSTTKLGAGDAMPFLKDIN